MRFPLPWKRTRTQQAAAPVVTGPSTEAIVFTAPYQAELRQVPLPKTGEWDVVVDMTATGISMGTERWAITGQRPDVAFPSIPGYLGVGRVREMGARVTDYQIGDRVTFFTARMPEGYTSSWMCAHMARAVLDCDPASYMPDYDMLYYLKVPEGVSDEEAAFAGLAAVPLQGIEMSDPQPGEKVAVFGLGMVGQFAAQLARDRGARVFACDTVQSRVDVAARNSANVAALVGTPAFHEAAYRFAPQGFDVVIDTTGSADALNSEIVYLRNHGRFVFQGWYPGLSALNLHNICCKFTRAFFPCGVRKEYVERCLALMAQGKLNAKPLITHRWSPKDAPAVYQRVAINDPTFLGEVFIWQS